jgi:hypothetical protein
LARSAVWSIPVISAVAAAPAFALSPCPAGTVSGSIPSSSFDRITITNGGPGSIAAGTTITWTIQNVRSSSATLTLGTVTGVSLSSGTNPISLASGASTTWTFVTTVAIPVGGAVWWNFSIAGWTYNSSVSMENCIKGCVSDRGSTIGSVCPTAPAVLATPTTTQLKGAGFTRTP